MRTPADGLVDAVRLDKWLWAARFFKTRHLATEAINGGKVHVDGQRAKPSKMVRPGATMTVQKGPLSWEIEVKAVGKQRRPASEAALLYEESESSRLRRQALVHEQRASGQYAPGQSNRPNKRDRRMIQRFIGKTGD